MSSEQGFNVLEAFPLVTEFITDTGIGYLIILLLYPFLYFLLTFPTTPIDYSILITVFSSSEEVLEKLSFASIFIAFIIGIASREFLWLVLSIFRKCRAEHFLAFLAYQTLQWQFGKGIFEFERIEESLIKKNPFSQVGEEDYADFRTNLVCNEGELQKYRKHWIHEEFFWLQFRRLYSFGLIFLLVYLLYGLFVIHYLYSKGGIPGNPYVTAWLIILTTSFLIAFSFYRGLVFHGVAFDTVDKLLRKKFKKSKKKR